MVTSGPAWRWARWLLAGWLRDLAGFSASLRPASRVQPGLYAYQANPPGGTRRIHLRIGEDGAGLLLVDVTDVVHLNPTAALVAKTALDKKPSARAAAALRVRFRHAERSRVEREVRRIYAMVEHLSTTTDRCPTCGLAGLERAPLFSTPVQAPYKADLALTYGCNNACRHCYNERGRTAMPSLGLDDWRRVLDKLASVGVPHVILTGGEPTLMAGLPELIEHADRLGLVTGLNTNGRRLADRSFTRSLARAGLSHVQITLESCLPEVHNAMTGAVSFHETVDGIRTALEAGLHTITNTTLTRRNVDHAEQIVEFLHRFGLRTFAMNGMIYSGAGRTSTDAIPEQELGSVVVRVRDRAEELGIRFLWYTPTAYCRLSPVELGLGPRRCNAGEYSIAIEPNGDVLPCQSYYTPVGNILRDGWSTIWHSPLLRSFRGRVTDPRGSGLPTECWDCPDLPLCGGGCRLEREKRITGNDRDQVAAPAIAEWKVQPANQ
jgi:radical SAM protein with 4Fe4S-binding SPASM domain